MQKLTPGMKNLIGNNLGYVATVDENGDPDIGPKMSITVLDDSHLMYYERTARQTLHNLRENGKLVIAVADLKTKKGYRFHGPVTLHEGMDDPIFARAIKYADDHQLKHPAVVPVMEITRIDWLDAGPKAGTVYSQD